MNISITDAQNQLADLVRRAEAGDEIVLTQDGQPAARLVPLRLGKRDPEFLALIAEIQKSASKNKTCGPDAARSQDFLYDEFGLPK